MMKKFRWLSFGMIGGIGLLAVHFVGRISQ